jgi:type IV pilus assembly protein PilP
MTSASLYPRKLLPLGAILALAGCSGTDDMIALQNYVQSAVNRPPSAIEPLPAFVSYEPFTYSAASLRSPFDLPIDINELMRSRNDEVQPDLNRTPEMLERFNLGSLAMMGTLSRSGVVWALIRDESGEISRVSIGNYMGRNHGRVISISETQIDLVEIVPTGSGGWVERPQTVLLQQQ